MCTGVVVWFSKHTQRRRGRQWHRQWNANFGQFIDLFVWPHLPYTLNSPFCICWTFNFPSLHKFSRWFRFSLVTSSTPFSLTYTSDSMYSMHSPYNAKIHTKTVYRAWTQFLFNYPTPKSLRYVSNAKTIRYCSLFSLLHKVNRMNGTNRKTNNAQTRTHVRWFSGEWKLPSNNANASAAIIATNCLQRRKDTWMMVNSIVIHALVPTTRFL